MVYKKALSDTDKNATKNRRKPAVVYCKYWKLCSVSAESEIGNCDHKAEAEKDQTIGEAVENVAGFLRKRNVEELARLRYKHIHILPLNRIAAVFFPCIRINRFFS